MKKKEPGAAPAGGGFTLLELALALVAVGLLVGAALLGKDLVANAQLQGLAADTQKLDAAVNAFQLKYSCVPGDCPYGMSLGLGLAQPDAGNGAYPCNNGDGDQRIGCQSVDACGGAAAACVWVPWIEPSMALVNLGAMGAIPAATWPAVNSGYMMPTRLPQVGLYLNSFQSGPSPGNYVLLANMLTKANPWLGLGGGGGLNGSLYPAEARWLDVKMDDGQANGGRLRPTRITNSTLHFNTEDGWAGTGDCWSGPDYNATTPSWQSCLLHLKLSGR